MNTNLHADGNCLTFGDVQQARHPVAHGQAQQVEQQRSKAHHRCVLDHGLPILGQRQDNGKGQEQCRHQFHRLLHACGKRRGVTANQHTQGDRQQDNRKYLQDLGKLQWNGLVRGHEPAQRQVHQQRHGQNRDQRVDGRERDVQRHIAMGQMAEQVGRGATRRSGQQHQPHRQGRLQAKAVGNQEAHQRQQQNLAGQAHHHWLGVLHHTSEVGQGQRQPKAEHDDA